MIGTYHRHQQRQVIDLSGTWDFVFLGSTDIHRVRLDRLKFDDRMAVPGCFDATPKYAGKRGVAVYRRFVTSTTDHPRRLLRLYGVHHWCRIWCDGQLLAEHAGGFTSFQVELPAATDGKPSELVILVDNRIDPQRCPLHLGYMDWYHHGGIARGAELHLTGHAMIDQLRLVTKNLAKRQVEIAITINSTRDMADVPLTIECQEQQLHQETVDLIAGDQTLVRRITVPWAKIWSPESPSLYSFLVRVGKDDSIQRFGFRTIGVKGRQILLNGQPLLLLGVNRHELHPQFGHTQPLPLLLGDLQQIKQMNANFIRGSHYPQDTAMLDLCDELGLLVWNEAIGWQQTSEHLQDESFLSAQEQHIREMIADSANHPCVIFWGLLNESHAHQPACRQGYERLTGLIRCLDDSRPVTYATSHPAEDRCLDLFDVISVNTYPGWYEGEIPEIPQRIRHVIEQLESHVQAGVRRKPILISEIGAEAIYGMRDINRDRWSEEHQAELLRVLLEHLIGRRQRLSGLAIWLFNDFRSSEEVGRILIRGRGYNNKGLVDEYRRPKLSMAVVAQGFARWRKQHGH